MKKDFKFDEIYPWQDKPQTTPTGGGGGPPPPGPATTPDKKPSTTPSGEGKGPSATPTGTDKGPGGTPSKDKDKTPSPTPTITKGGGKPPESSQEGKDEYVPQNLDDHIEIGNEPEEVLPTGDKPQILNDEERERKRNQIKEEIKQRSHERGRGRGDKLFPNEYMEFDTVPTVNYKVELQRLLQKLSIIYSDKLHPQSYSYGYAEYKTEKVPEKLSVAIAIDTSGSVADKAKEFLNEAFKISRSFPKLQLLVILFNDGVYKVGFSKSKADAANLIAAFLPEVESGGTQMSPVARIVTDSIMNKKLGKDTVVIYFTDGIIEENCTLSTLAKANYIYVVEGGSLNALLPLKKKYSNLRISWINI